MYQSFAHASLQKCAWSVVRPMCLTTTTSVPGKYVCPQWGQVFFGFRWKNDLKGLSISPPCVGAQLLKEHVHDLLVEVVRHTLVRYVCLKFIVTLPAEYEHLSIVLPAIYPFGIDVVSGKNTYKVATRARPFMLRHRFPP